jgi:vitamin B12 transporter
MKKINIILITFLTLISFNKLFAGDIPIIVISPSKTPQSASTVGTSVTVLNEQDLENSNRSFLGDSLEKSVTGLNMFQTGGPGTQMGLQLRGLPKAYTTVYVDGVKKADATTPKNDFYFDDILTGQVSRVEILKGNQSSMYGSGAMGGAINISSKKGSGEYKEKISYNAGSDKTHNLNLSYGGSDDNKDFYVGLERFQTDGLSAMNHNDESDPYKNHTFLTNYGYNFSDTLKLRSIYKFTDSKLHYDAIRSDFNQIDNKSHERDSSATIKVDYKPTDNLNSNLILGSGYMSRTADNIKSQFVNTVVEQDYWSYRNTVSLNNNYKIGSNHNIAFGLEKEFEEMRYNEVSHIDFKKGEEVTSQYIDVQSKLTNNLYTTMGVRFDQHSQSLNEDSERISLAYLSDKLGATFKSSYGTGIKFPSLYEYYKSSKPDSLVAEKGRSFDFGVQKDFINKGLDIDLTFFNHKYEDTIEGWKSASWTPVNMPGVVRTRGIELLSKFKPKKNLNFNLGYTYNSTYDGADFDDPDLGPGSAGDFLNSQMVRVPRHLINIGANYNIGNNMNLNWKTKWSDSARDYGNGNSAETGGNYRDMRLPSYAVSDLELDFLYGDYKSFINLTNLFNKKYSQAVQFSAPERALNFGFKKVY